MVRLPSQTLASSVWCCIQLAYLFIYLAIIIGGDKGLGGGGGGGGWGSSA